MRLINRHFAVMSEVKEALLRVGTTLFRVEEKLDEFETAFYRRDKLPLQRELAGPAIILQTDSTTVVPPNWSLVANKNGTLTMTLREQ